MKNIKGPVNNKKPARPVPVKTILVHVMSDGQVAVSKFPKNFKIANRIMEEAHRAVNKYFVDKAREGRVDDLGNVDGSGIVVTSKMPPEPK